jgi:hypothetical protein
MIETEPTKFKIFVSDKMIIFFFILQKLNDKSLPNKIITLDCDKNDRPFFIWSKKCDDHHNHNKNDRPFLDGQNIGL